MSFTEFYILQTVLFVKENIENFIENKISHYYYSSITIQLKNSKINVNIDVLSQVVLLLLDSGSNHFPNFGILYKK